MVVPERVSETDWAALPRTFWASARMPWPWFEASSVPERVESPSFWVADLSPSERRVSKEASRQVQWRKLTRLDSTGSAVSEPSDGLAGLVESRLLGVGGDLLLGLLAESLASGDS